MKTASEGSPNRPPRFLADENIERAIVEGVRRKRPGVTFLTAGEAKVLHLSDPEVLQRARELDLILVSPDRKTMYDHFASFLMNLPPGEHCPGLLLVSQDKHSIGQIIDFILEVYDLSSHEEWRDLPTPLPL